MALWNTVYNHCDSCHQPMKPGYGCTQKSYDDFDDAVERDRLPYIGTPEFCLDCQVAKGQHHHPGCEAEACAKCGGQAIGCDCAIEEPDDDDTPGPERLHHG